MAPPDADPNAAPSTEPQQPASPAALFSAFNRLALQGFGGVLPVAQRELVDRLRWLSPADFLQLLSLGQVLPGPNIVNLALMYGHRCFGWRGALAAASGLLLAPLLIVLLAAVAYRELASVPIVVNALRGMGAVAAGLVIASGCKLVAALDKHPLGQPIALGYAALTTLMVGLLHWPMVSVVIGLALLALMHSHWRAQLVKGTQKAAPPADSP